MIFENNHTQVYLACGPTDMRKSIDGLAVLVKEGFNLDPFSSCLYVFCNRKRDKLKILKLSRGRDNLSYSEIIVIPTLNTIAVKVQFV
ncbi:MAG: IS66 family insertion sequence element accessory protein TnpB [Bacillota bacterium]